MKWWTIVQLLEFYSLFYTCFAFFSSQFSLELNAMSNLINHLGIITLSCVFRPWNVIFHCLNGCENWKKISNFILKIDASREKKININALNSQHLTRKSRLNLKNFAVINFDWNIFEMINLVHTFLEEPFASLLFDPHQKSQKCVWLTFCHFYAVVSLHKQCSIGSS